MFSFLKRLADNLKSDKRRWVEGMAVKEETVVKILEIRRSGSFAKADVEFFIKYKQNGSLKGLFIFQPYYCKPIGNVINPVHNFNQASYGKLVDWMLEDKFPIMLNIGNAKSLGYYLQDMA